MEYTEAKQLVCNYLAKHHKKIASNEEMEAIITHWFFNPGIRPPYFSNAAYNACKQLFGLSPTEISNKSLVREESAPYQLKFDFVYNRIPYPPPEKHEFSFVDLFAGIGGFRIAFQNIGGNCVFTSEWDKHAKKTSFRKK